MATNSKNFMKISKIAKMKGGWFIGDFEPTAFHSKDFEVSYKVHKKGEKWDTHTHKIATEINLLIEGRMENCGVPIKSGDIFIVYPNEKMEPIFHEDCKIICVKTPSVKGDKHIIP